MPCPSDTALCVFLREIAKNEIFKRKELLLMGGRQKKSASVATGKIGKEAIQAKLTQEEKLKLSRKGLTPPSWLDAFAAEEFSRVVDEAGNINLLDNLDLSILAVYSNAYSRYIEATKFINENGITGDRETKYGIQEVVSPYVLAQEKYVKQIMQCSTKLGLATTDRLKLIVPCEEMPATNKYLKYAEK